MGIWFNGQRIDLRFEVNAALIPALAHKLTHEAARESSPSDERSSQADEAAMVAVTFPRPA